MTTYPDPDPKPAPSQPQPPAPSPLTLAPLRRVTDVLLCSSVREGLNLLPFEYLLTREHSPCGPGAMVVSEFSASARVLSGGVPCNPWSIRKVGAAIEQAISLSPTQRAQRSAPDLAFVRGNTASMWAGAARSNVPPLGWRRSAPGPCLLGLAQLALGGAPHSGGAAVPLGAQRRGRGTGSRLGQRGGPSSRPPPPPLHRPGGSCATSASPRGPTRRCALRAAASASA